MTLSQKKRQKIIDYWNSGLTVPAIAKIMNLWENTIRNILRTEGLYPRLYTPSGYAQQGSPKLITFYHGNQPLQQPTPQQIYQQQIATEQGPKLIHELDNRNRENKDLKEKLQQVNNENEKEIKEKEKLQENVDTLIDSVGKIEGNHRRDLELKEKDIEELKQQKTNLTDELKLRDNRINEIQDKGDKRHEKMLEILQDQQSQLEKLRGRDTDRELYLQENRHTLQRLKDGAEEMAAKLLDQEELIKIRTNERNEFKDKFESLERKHQYDWMFNLLVALVGFLIGTVTEGTVLPKIKEFILSWGAKYGINTADVANQFSQVNVVQADTHDIYSGAIPVTIASSTFWSGACFPLNGEAHNPRCEPVLNPQGDIPFSPLSSITSGVELITNVSGIQCSGTYVSSYLENIPLQDANIIYTSSPLVIPSYSYMPLTPPKNPLDSLLWRQILELDEEQLKQYLKRYLEHLGYRVTLMKSSHDWGVDMIIERGWERIVIQLKQWKDPIGLDAIREVHTAIKHYKATRAIVICTSTFTKNALELASENNVECLDAKQLLSELYKHGYFLPPQ